MPDINLRQMAINPSGIIAAAVRVGGELGRSIREMNGPCACGTEITVKQQRAPLNDPVALRIMGGTLTLRNCEADHIMVTVADKPLPP